MLSGNVTARFAVAVGSVKVAVDPLGADIIIAGLVTPFEPTEDFIAMFRPGAAMPHLTPLVHTNVVWVMGVGTQFIEPLPAPP